MNYSLILSDTTRSLKYLKEIYSSGFIVESVFLYSLNNSSKLLKYCLSKRIKFINLKSNSINSKLSKNKILSSKYKNFIFSGTPGEVVNEDLLIKKNLYHCHPGKLPQFKGSTILYYSLLLKKKICCSIIKLKKKIDVGSVFFEKYHLPPKNRYTLENFYDDDIRAKTILSFIKKKNISKIKKNGLKKFPHYYICHPLIRAIVIQKNKINYIFKSKK